MTGQLTSIPWQHRIDPYPAQRRAMFDPPQNAVILASPKAGKAQPLDALVYTPTGPVRMGDIEPGDEVLTPEGGRAKVLGIHPQGVRDIYRVTFSDGRSTECTSDHLWEVGFRNQAPRVMALGDITELSPDYFRRSFVPTADPVDYDDCPVPIDPYLLGVLLGDGGLKYSIAVSLPDDHIRERVEAALPAGHELVYRDQYDWAIITDSHWTNHPQRMHVLLRQLGLYGKGSPDKFIPDIYKYNSVEVRMEMLRGLLDTDGWVDNKGQPHFDSSSRHLADDVRELVEGLGGFAYYGIKPVPGFLDSHRLSIVHPDAPSLFTLPRKREATRPKVKPTRRKFRAVEWVRRAEAQCISIDDPRGLYLTDHAIVTHNTIAALQWLIEQTEQRGGNHRRFLWVAPNYGQSKIAFRRAYQEVLDLGEVDLHKTDHTITLPDSSVIFFGSADKPDSIYGEDYHAVVCDEATRMSLEAWIAITSTTQHTGAKFRLIGNNTRRPNWAKKLAIRARKGELPGWEYHKLDRADAMAAGVVDTATDEATRLLIPEDEYRILYEGEDVEREGIFLPTDRLTVEPVPEMVLVARGWDLASTKGGDFTVGFKIAANSTGFWLVDAVRERLEAHEVVDLVRRTAVEDGPAVEQIIEEEKGSSGMIQTDFFRRMLDETPGAGPLYEAPVEVSKQVRAWPLVAQMGAGRYHMAPGFHHSEVLAEMEEWPDSANDDVVDALAHAHNHLAPLVSGMIGSAVSR